MVVDIKLVLDSTHYSPGSTVQGRLVVSVDKSKSYHSIVVKLWGRAHVHWTESRTVSSSNNTTRTETVVYSNSETYMDIEIAVWKLENSPTGNLPIGEHSFPFSFQLHQNLPPSFEGACGSVRYEVESKIVHSGLLNAIIKSKHMRKARLTISGGIPSPEFQRLYYQPATASDTKTVGVLCFKSGTISATATLPRTGFSPGEVIPINVQVNNESSKKVNVSSVLRRVDTFIASGGNRRTVPNLIAKTVSSAITPGTGTSYEDGNLRLPTEVQMTIRDCSCIKVEYVLTIEVQIPWSFNMKMQIPLVIAKYGSAPEAGVPFGLEPPPPAGYNATPYPPYVPTVEPAALKKQMMEPLLPS